MKNDVLKGKGNTSERSRRRKNRVVSFLMTAALLVGNCSAFAVPAVSAEPTPSCGRTEHIHTESCYTQKKELICGQEEAAGHSHTDACYSESRRLVCGQEESAGHTHGPECFTENKKLTCGQEEGADHTHNDDCYTIEKIQTCQKAESAGHSHTDACYQTERELICGQEETAGHSHTDACYQVQNVLTCTQEEHTHTAECYQTDAPQDTDTKDTEVDETEAGTEPETEKITETEKKTEAARDGEPEDLGGFIRSITVERRAPGATDGWEVLANKVEPDGPEMTLTVKETDEIRFTVEYKLPGKAIPDTDTVEYKLPLQPKEAKEAEKKETAYAQDKSEAIGESVTKTDGKLSITFDEKYLKANDDGRELEGMYQFLADAGQIGWTEDGTARLRFLAEKENPNARGTEKAVELIFNKEETEPESELPGLTEEEQLQVEQVIALIDALPSYEEIGEKLAAFEEAEDDEGYEEYFAEVYAQVMEAYKAYTALTEDQKLWVTNADKLMALEWLWSAQTMDVDFAPLEDDSAYVTDIAVNSIYDGTAPWDSDDNAGNDSNAENKVVRTFDTVTYNFEVTMRSYEESLAYSQARVKLEFVLPLTSEQAVFDQGAMAWMDQTDGYEPKVTTETRSINGVETQCQVMTCYKLLLPAADHPSVVPGTFGENVTVNVKSMKNGDTFAPIFSAAMEYGSWDGDCEKHERPEKATVTADKITVSAAPKYNIRIGCASSYKSTFDFNTGNTIAAGYGEGYGKSQVTGRAVKYGVVIQLYNDNASRKLKGIELPDGSPISFDLKVSSEFTINNPNSGYNQGEKVNTTSDYMPLLWSCDGNIPTGSGAANSDGRVLYDSHGCAQGLAPYANGGSSNSCYKSGQWRATQEGDTIHVTVSGYQIDVDKMPVTNGDTSTGSTGAYGVDLGIGCFSAGEIWLVQPYNKIGDTSTNQGPEFDVVTEYGQGKFDTSAHAINMKAVTVSGTAFADPEGTSNAQMKNNDDWVGTGVELTLPGGLQNRVAYANPSNYNSGVGVSDYRSGLDFATAGTEIRLLGGFSYNHRNEEENTLYWGTNLTKFYGSAIEIIDSPAPNMILTEGAHAEEFTVLYATKSDGTDWKSDYELLHTYEDEMVFYKSPSDIPSGQLCVGLLICFKKDTFGTVSEPYFFGQQPARVRNNMDLNGNSYILASTSRVWTKGMFEQEGMTLDQIPDWTDPGTKLSDFPAGCYKSANIDGSTWYTKTDYSQAENGIVKDHNSDWRHWGDTLLVIGYKTEITKTMPQRDSQSSSEKNTYNLDAEQRVVDFMLQPYTKYDQGGGNQGLTTTVTIVDTLPKHLSYVPGSCYFGGEYHQTSPNGGTQGSITGGIQHEPDNVVKNADGTQTLTWIITGVTVGEAMPPIYYSASIGDRNNPEEDVPTGTTQLVNKVRIYATHDVREPSVANRNYAEAGLSVTRGAAASYGKYSEQNVVDADGVIDYVIYYDNNGSTAEATPVLVDAMPVEGVGRSNFKGTWEITNFKVSLTGISGNVTLENLDAELSYTTDRYYAGKTLADLQAEQGNPKGSWEDPVDVPNDGSVKELVGKTPVMWVLNCISLPAGSELRVEYSIKLQPEPGRTIENVQYANTFSTSKTTTTTETPVVNRTLEGLTWLDENADGVQNEKAESRISGVKVTLLKLRDGGDASNESDYEPYHYQGDSSLPAVEVQTGKSVSVRAYNSDAATDYEPGRYKFTDLPAGTFAVRFEDGTGETKISSLIASPSNQGEDDTRDSDGIAAYSADKARLKKTVILGIEMPKAEDMSVVLYESRYHDSGFYRKSYKLPNTGGPGTNSYTMGGLLITIAAGWLLLYNERKRRKEDMASS